MTRHITPGFGDYTPFSFSAAATYELEKIFDGETPEVRSKLIDAIKEACGMAAAEISLHATNKVALTRKMIKDAIQAAHALQSALAAIPPGAQASLRGLPEQLAVDNIIAGLHAAEVQADDMPSGKLPLAYRDRLAQTIAIAMMQNGIRPKLVRDDDYPDLKGARFYKALGVALDAVEGVAPADYFNHAKIGIDLMERQLDIT